jgi:Protein of unknown function (DUF1761)
MLPLFWLLLFLVGAYLFLLMPVLWGREIYNHYRGSRAVTCPETHQQVAVSFDALHAAATGLSGQPNLRLAECTRWPMRADCGQECMPEAQQTGPYTKGEVDLPKTKKIYHLPVLIAAFAAYVLGALWHSQYIFREQWREAVGLSRTELQQILWWRTPHLLSLAAPLLFAYGVAWLLAWRGRKGVWQGIITSTFLWVALVVASLASTGWAGISVDLLKMEVAYTFLASVAIGAIIGGLSGKLVEPAFEEK